jgi:hypothetical protein
MKDMKIKITSHRDEALVGKYATIESRGENFKDIYRVRLEGTNQVEYVCQGGFVPANDDEKVNLSVKIDSKLFTKLTIHSRELDMSIDEYVESILRASNGR